MSRTRRTALVVAALLTLTLPAPAGAAPPNERAAPGQVSRWLGLRGDHGWVGGSRLDGRIVYRLDPGRPARSGYGGAATVADAGGRADGTETARAAYILSRYGTYEYAVQAAAVDVAVTSLLGGKRDALTGARTAKRLQGLRQRAKVLDFARTMLRRSAREAGAPVLTVTATDAASGGQVRATAHLQGALQAPIAGHDVRLTFPGADPQVVRTDAAGNASATFPAGGGGRAAATATALGLPEWRLSVHESAHRRASRLARAGIKADLGASHTSTVTVQPTVTVTSPAQGLIQHGTPGQFVLAGGQPGARTTTMRLWGPFATPSGCAGAIAATRSMTVSDNGTYPIPDSAAPAPAAGFYAWEVLVAGDGVNRTASACGPSMAVQTQPAVGIVQDPDTINDGDLRPKVDVAGLPDNQGYGADAKISIFGPFQDRANAHCGDGRFLKSRPVTVTGNGTFRPEQIPVGQPGFFTLQVELPGGTFSTPAISACRAAGSIFKVT